MIDIKQQRSQSLTEALKYVSHSCATKAEYILYGGYELEKDDSYEKLSHECFLYEYNKYYSINYSDEKIIKRSKLHRIIYNNSRSFYFNEAKLFIKFLFNFIKNNTKIDDKEQSLLELRPYLSKILVKHKTEEDSFDIDSYLDNLYGISHNVNKSQNRSQPAEKLFINKDKEISENNKIKTQKIDNKCAPGNTTELQQFSQEQSSLLDTNFNYELAYENRSFIFKLNDYVGKEFGEEISLSDIAEKLNISKSIFYGSRAFTIDEAKKLVSFYLEIGKKHSNIFELRSRFYYFLLNYYDNEEKVNTLLNELCGSSKILDLPRISRDAKIIRKSIEKEMSEILKRNKIIFLSGSKFSGKTFIARFFAHHYCSIHNCDIAIWYNCKNDESFDDFINYILLKDTSLDYSTLSLNEKTEKAKKLLNSNASIVIIDDLENCIDEINRDKIISFLSFINNATIIIISEREMKNYKKCLYNQDIFDEIRIRPITREEWHEYVKEKANCDEQIQYKLSIYKNLEEQLFNYFGNGKFPVLTIIEEFNRICSNNFDIPYYDIIKRLEYISKTSDEFLFNSLSHESHCLLVCLSYFSDPIPLSLISELTGIPEVVSMGSCLLYACEECKNYHFLIEHSLGFSINKNILPIIDNAIKNNPKAYGKITNNCNLFFHKGPKKQQLDSSAVNEM